MKYASTASVLLILMTVSLSIYSQKAPDLPDVTVFRGKNLMENAFLIASGNTLVLIDAMASGSAATEIVKTLNGKKLNMIFVTHGHPDHFMGLSTIMKINPNVQVYVGSEGVKKDILSYAKFATSKDMLEDDPEMKIKSSKNTAGFDYDLIKIVSGNKIDLGNGNTLTIESIEGPTECANNTILYSEELKLLFASDLLYNKVFNWLGTVDQPALENWIATLKELQGRFTQQGLVIYPGHGQRNDADLFDANIQYLTSFKSILRRTSGKSDAHAFFKQLYPEHRGEFLLSRSIDRWTDSTKLSNSISIVNIRDLTHTLDDKFPFIPVPGITFPFELKPIATMEGHGVRANKWIIHEHIGTQIDAPNHFAPEGIALERLMVEDLIVPVVVIDISKKSSLSADAELTVADIKGWESTNGTIPENACVMMYSGWEKFLHEEKYLGVDLAHVKHFPGIAEAAVRFLVAERSISGLGVDVISLDPGYDNEYKGHKILLGAGKWALEAVANLNLIPVKGAFLIVGAPKIKGATGGIVRLLAVW